MLDPPVSVLILPSGSDARSPLSELILSKGVNDKLKVPFRDLIGIEDDLEMVSYQP